MKEAGAILEIERSETPAGRVLPRGTSESIDDTLQGRRQLSVLPKKQYRNSIEIRASLGMLKSNISGLLLEQGTTQSYSS